MKDIERHLERHLSVEKPVFSTENPGLQRKTRFFLRETQFFSEKPVFSGVKPGFSEKLGFSAVKQGCLAQTLLFWHSMKTQVFKRKHRFSTENPGFQQKTQVFRQKNPACRPLPIRLAIARKPCLTADNPSFSEKPSFSQKKRLFPRKNGFFSGKNQVFLCKLGFSVEKPGFSGASLKIKVPFNFLHVL